MNTTVVIQQSSPQDNYKRKHKWTPEEDNLLKEAVFQFGSHNWDFISRHVPGRTGKQCRERWLVRVDPNIKKDSWTQEEDETLIQLQNKFGNKWARFIPYFNGRSSSNIKNRWMLLSKEQPFTNIAEIHRSNDINQERWRKLEIFQESISIIDAESTKLWF